MPRPSPWPDDIGGMKIGERTILAEVERRRGQRTARAMCSCGNVTETTLNNLRLSERCRNCAQRRKAQQRRESNGLPVPKTRREPLSEVGAILREAGDRCPEVWRSNAPEGVAAAIELVDLLGPLTLAEVGELLGVTRERIRQIEERALKRLRLRCKLARLDPDLFEHSTSEHELLELQAWG